MNIRTILQLVVVVLLLLFACRREYSQEGYKQPLTDSFSTHYPCEGGFCKDGVSLGVNIVDTVNYIPSDTSALPDSLFLDMPLPGDQSNQKSCSAWATVYTAGSYYQHISTGKPYSDTGNLSPKFTYNQIAKGTCSCTSILDNLYLLNTQGACSLKNMPYNPDECAKQPDSLQKAEAEVYKIKGWQKVDLNNLTTIKRAIREEKPVIFAIDVDLSFDNLMAPYIWKVRDGSKSIGHALVIAGFDDSKNAFWVENSWSSGWADKGFAWIDYDFFLQNAIQDGYVLM